MSSEINSSNPRSLDRLAEMVRQAEARTRAQKLGAETQQAAEALRAVETHSRVLEARLRDERPNLLRALAEVAEDEQRLKELIRKVAQLLGAAALDPADGRQFEREIETSRAEIDARRRRHQQALDALNREVLECRRSLQAALDAYQVLRRDVDRLQPEAAEQFAADDRLARAAEVLFPAGQVRALAREVDDASTHFGMLETKEQLAQLTIWIGRFRRLQAMEGAGLSDDDQATLQRVFPRLVGLSKHYEPGYIEAFRQGYTTDWDAYVADAEDQLRRASEQARQRRLIEQRRRDQQGRDLDRAQRGREAGLAALAELRAQLERPSPSAVTPAEFQEGVARALAGLDPSEPELLALAGPHRDLLTGGDFRALRRALDRDVTPPAAPSEAPDEAAPQAEYADLIPRTRGRSAVLVGGSAREAQRRALERLFAFETLDWETLDPARPALLDAIESRIRQHGVDLVLCLRGAAGVDASERLQAVSAQAGVPCLVLEPGAGPAQVAAALRDTLQA